ncbi:MAG TPA: hypothetical protein VFR34_10715, partial [Paracoccaceae bacterium]|nr:hypothetical protein [Paracoccaceae bacterium]
PGGGYHAPELRLMNGGQPSADGMIELEFVARPPEPDAPAPTNTGSMRMIAAQFIAADILGAARGVRVHAVGGATERLLGPPPETTPAQEPAG